MALPAELRAALRYLRKVRSEHPGCGCTCEDYAAWREKIANALDLLALVLIYEEDRQRAREEARAARDEAIKIRRELRTSDE